MIKNFGRNKKLDGLRKTRGLTMDISKSDLKKFRNNIGKWQELYMEKLCKEYVDLLQSDNLPSEKFWELEERIKADKKRPGVMVSIGRDELIYDIVGLIKDEAITFEDLDEFSDELRDRVQKILSM